jgi:hypothetical protein
MRIKIEVEFRRPARRSVAPLIGLLLLAAPAVVLASHQFSDVSDGHPFHTEISAIAGAGITAGFSDGNFHPADAVTRQAMAAFMQRGLGRAALAINTTPMTTSVDVGAGTNFSNHVPVHQLTITVPGASNGFSPMQVVHLQGRVTFLTSMSNSDKGCPCQFAVAIRDTAANSFSYEQYQTFESTSVASWAYSLDVEAIFAAPPGPRTYELDARLSFRNSIANPASFSLYEGSSLSAMTFPFGPTGTSDL